MRGKKKSQLTRSEVVVLACRECLLSGVGGWDVCLVVIESDKGQRNMDGVYNRM